MSEPSSFSDFQWSWLLDPKAFPPYALYSISWPPTTNELSVGYPFNEYEFSKYFKIYRCIFNSYITFCPMNVQFETLNPYTHFHYDFSKIAGTLLLLFFLFCLLLTSSSSLEEVWSSGTLKKSGGYFTMDGRLVRLARLIASTTSLSDISDMLTNGETGTPWELSDERRIMSWASGELPK